MATCHTNTPEQAVLATPAISSAIGFGLLGTSGLLLLYFGMLTVLSGWAFTLDQFRAFWPYITALAVGFGVQVGLFATLHRTLHAGGAGKVVATTGTTSSLAMLACCAHYLVGLLPALGATGLVAIIGDYQVELFWFALAANLVGIVVIGQRLRSVRQAAGLAMVLAILTLAAPWEASAEPLPPQVDKQGKVTVQVTPLALADREWRFQVVFDTHVVALDHDLRAIAALAAPDGRAVRPTAWDGDPPGGHHRKGILVFPALSPAPSAITLRIRDVGPVPERSFTWALGVGEERRSP